MKRLFILFISFVFLILNFSQTNATKGLFDNYITWNNSTTLNSADNLYYLLEMLVHDNNNSGNYGYSFIDINGDGLSDFVYKGNLWPFPYNSNTTSALQKMAILINNGDMTYKVQYKCVVETSTSNIVKFYGNCAQ